MAARATRRTAYVGSYTGFDKKGQLGWVGTPNAGKGISVFEFDEDKGKLTPTGKVIEQDCPTWVQVHPSGRWLVACHELSAHVGAKEGDGFLSSYSIDEDGGLTRVCTTPTSGRGNTCVAFDHTGRFVMTTRYWEGGVAVLPFNVDDGTIGPVSCAPLHKGIGPHPLRQSMPHPHGILGDPKTDLVYAADLGTDCVHQYRLTDAGVLVPLEGPFAEIKMGPGSGPRGLNFHPLLRVAYVNCELSGTVVVCAINDETGLQPLQSLGAYPANFVAEGHEDNFGKAAFWGAEAVITRDGKWYYYICRVHHSLAIFAVQPDGRLSPAGRQALAPKSNPRNLTLDVSGRHVLVACQDADAVEVFRIDSSNGTLTRTDMAAAPCAADVAVV